MLAWIIAAPNCNHWPVIQGAVEAWTKPRHWQSTAQHRLQRHKRLSQLIVDPAEGPFAEAAGEWAKSRKLTLVNQGQPDVIFVCRRELATKDAAARLAEQFNPGRIVRIDGHGKLSELKVPRQPG